MLDPPSWTSVPSGAPPAARRCWSAEGGRVVIGCLCDRASFSAKERADLRPSRPARAFPRLVTRRTACPLCGERTNQRVGLVLRALPSHRQPGPRDSRARHGGAGCGWCCCERARPAADRAPAPFPSGAGACRLPRILFLGGLAGRQRRPPPRLCCAIAPLRQCLRRLLGAAPGSNCCRGDCSGRQSTGAKALIWGGETAEAADSGCASVNEVTELLFTKNDAGAAFFKEKNACRSVCG